ncbi:hypothetical protein OIU84_005869 [Salix udensis]|uniref:Aldehyde dehydrogenase domain-containing protein n=1 Tax=Salix udensis TaxID=889485 RepID=A0AAD6P1G5_9ROSI|nr:hypothetical protein OIU84_005869 [Salix udensis]
MSFMAPMVLHRIHAVLRILSGFLGKRHFLANYITAFGAEISWFALNEELDIVDYICDDADVKAISFIGSDPAGLHIYARAAARGKRVQSNIGGKKHAITMPDASIDDTLNALAAAGFGAAGKRCMALSTTVFVGGSSAWYF